MGASSSTARYPPRDLFPWRGSRIEVDETLLALLSHDLIDELRKFASAWFDDRTRLFLVEQWPLPSSSNFALLTDPLVACIHTDRDSIIYYDLRVPGKWNWLLKRESKDDIVSSFLLLKRHRLLAVASFSKSHGPCKIGFFDVESKARVKARDIVPHSVGVDPADRYQILKMEKVRGMPTGLCCLYCGPQKKPRFTLIWDIDSKAKLLQTEGEFFTPQVQFRATDRTNLLAYVACNYAESDSHEHVAVVRCLETGDIILRCGVNSGDRELSYLSPTTLLLRNSVKDISNGEATEVRILRQLGTHTLHHQEMWVTTDGRAEEGSKTEVWNLRDGLMISNWRRHGSPQSCISIHVLLKGSILLYVSLHDAPATYLWTFYRISDGLKLKTFLVPSVGILGKVKATVDALYCTISSGNQVRLAVVNLRYAPGNPSYTGSLPANMFAQ